MPGAPETAASNATRNTSPCQDRPRRRCCSRTTPGVWIVWQVRYKNRSLRKHLEHIKVADLDFNWWPMLTHPRYLDPPVLWVGNLHTLSSETKALYRAVDPLRLPTPALCPPLPGQPGCKEALQRLQEEIVELYAASSNHNLHAPRAWRPRTIPPSPPYTPPSPSPPPPERRANPNPQPLLPPIPRAPSPCSLIWQDQQ